MNPRAPRGNFAARTALFYVFYTVLLQFVLLFDNSFCFRSLQKKDVILSIEKREAVFPPPKKRRKMQEKKECDKASAAPFRGREE